MHTERFYIIPEKDIEDCIYFDTFEEAEYYLEYVNQEDDTFVISNKVKTYSKVEV